MLTIAGYRSSVNIYESATSTVYRAVREQDDRPILEGMSPEQIAALRDE